MRPGINALTPAALQTLPTENLKGAQQIPVLQQNLDLSKLFYKCMLYNAATGMTEFYFINASQIPQALLPSFKSAITPVDIEEGKLPPKQRMKIWRSKYGKVYEVTSLTPQNIIGMRGTDFLRKYRETLKSVLERTLAPAHMVHAKNDGNSLKVKSLTTPGKVYIKGDERLKNTEEFRQALLAADTMFQTEDLYRVINKVINTTDLKLSPNESTRTLFDSILQALIASSNLAPKSKQALAKSVMSFWGRFLYLINLAISDGFDDLDASQSSILRAKEIMIESRRSIQDKFETDEPLLCEKIAVVYDSFLQLLDHCLALQDENYRHAIIEVFAKLSNGTLQDFGDLHLTMDTSRRYLIDMLKTKAKNLRLSCEVLDPAIIESMDYVSKASTIANAIGMQNWLIVFHDLQTLVDELQSSIKCEKFKQINNILIPIITERDFEKVRALHFARGLNTDLRYILSEGSLFKPVSEVALERMRDSFAEMAAPLAKTNDILPEFNDWVNALKEKGDRELFKSLKLMTPQWKQLREIKRELMNSQAFINDIQHLCKLVDNENFEEFSILYGEIAERLLGAIQAWEATLRKLNEHILQVQNLSLFMLSNPDLPKLEPVHLQRQFAQFNDRLGALIRPTTLFFSSFQQLISIGKASDMLKVSSKSIAIKFGSKGTPFALSLFDTRDAYFSALKVNLQQIIPNESAIIEIEIEEELSKEEVTAVSVINVQSEDQPSVSSNSEKVELLQEQVKEIFKQTKKRIVVQNLKALIKEYAVSFFTRFGKGDHNKLYINGVPIVMPEHKEWKPGTAKSIQNDVLEQLQQFIGISSE